MLIWLDLEGGAGGKKAVSTRWQFIGSHGVSRNGNSRRWSAILISSCPTHTVYLVGTQIHNVLRVMLLEHS